MNKLLASDNLVELEFNEQAQIETFRCYVSTDVNLLTLTLLAGEAVALDDQWSEAEYFSISERVLAREYFYFVPHPLR